jgi:O-antigen/teichoic acid export membrane protein
MSMIDILEIRNYVSDFFSKGHERTLNAKRNIFYSIVIKGLSILVSLLLVPLTLHYVNSERYGIWLTLSSIIAWFGFFDIGLGNGMRNCFAEAKAQGDNKLARIYISTTYAILTIIITVVWLIFCVVNPIIDWTRILNTSPSLRGELNILAFLVISFFCLRFVFQLITTVLIADQKPAKASFYNLLGNMLSLLIIYILTKTTPGSLFKLALVLGGMPVMVLIIASMIYYNGKYRDYTPSIRFIHFGHIRNLMNLGIKFFFIQIAALVIYQTSNIIIAQLYGPAEVTPFNIAFRYFNIGTMTFGIIMTPFWSAITEAWVKHDITWIQNVMRKLIRIWIILSVGIVLMLILSNSFYKLWVGKDVHIPFKLSIVMALYVIVFTWCSIFAQFINGVGKIKLQLYSGAFGAIINIPLSIYLGKIFGVAGVTMSSLILGLISSVWSPIQYLKLIRNTATGIWNK